VPEMVRESSKDMDRLPQIGVKLRDLAKHLRKANPKAWELKTRPFSMTAFKLA